MTIKKKLFIVYCRVHSVQTPTVGTGVTQGEDKTASAGPGARLPPEVKSEERTTGAAWAGWGWTQAPWSETES